MAKLLTILLIGIQLGFTFAVLVGIYMLFALLDNSGGFESFLGLLVFQPVMAVILSGLTIVLCFIVGLPIRLNRTINEWWTRNLTVAILLAIVGFILLFLSLLPPFTEVITISIDEDFVNKTIPNGRLAITGWLTSAFALLHIYPPYILKQKTAALLNRIKL